MSMVEVKVPDIGDFKDVEVIELLVRPGDRVQPEQSLVTVESDKASMEIPSSHGGVVKELKVKLGDKVSEGSALLTLDAEDEAAAPPAQAKQGQGGPAGGPGAPAAAAPPAAAPAETPAETSESPPAATPAAGAQAATPPAAPGGGLVEVKVPDIGDFKDVGVIEVFVKPGDRIAVEQSLITVESDKASMEIPSTHAGVVKEVKVGLGDKVSEGSTIALVEADGAGAAAPQPSAPAGAAAQAQRPAAAPAAAAGAPAAPAAAGAPVEREPAPPPPGRVVPTAALPPPEPAPPAGPLPHASPSVRKFARELGVPLDEVKGSGPKGRITHEDVQAFIKGVMAGDRQTRAAAAKAPAAGGLPGLLPWPQVDFEKFGPVERKALSRIRKISGANLHRNWVTIPHVTNHEDADVTDLEAFRVALNRENDKSGVKVTLLAFLVKACVAALRKFPEFNASLDGETLVLKQYYHIGFAADTPNGLVVPVIRDADRKGVLQIAQETAELAKKARDGKLSPADMSGGTFSISSLGGLGGTYFTPIINAPEVAILGVCRSATRPGWDGERFAPRLILPLSLSWDHRVIDGAAAARFNTYLAGILADFRRVLL